MKKYNFLIYCSIILSIVSCSSNKTGCPEPDYSLSMEITDTLFLTIDTALNYQHKHVNILDTDSGFIYFAIDENKKIQMYNLSKDSIIFEKQLAKEGPEYFQTNGIYVHNFDSIYAIGEEPIVITLLNSRGEIQRKWKVEEAPNGDKRFYASSSWSREPCYRRETNTLYFYLTSAKSEEEMLNSPTIAAYNLSTSTFDAYFGNLPAEFTYADQYPWAEEPCFAVQDSFTLISFEMTDKTDLYNSNTGEFIRQICAGSKYVSGIEPCENCQENLQNKVNYVNSEASFSRLLYDKYNDLYYRTAKHEIPVKNDEGLLNMALNASWSVIIMNNKFEIIGEYKFPPNKYWVVNLHPVKGGLLVGTNNPENPDTKENVIEYHLFKLTKNE